MREKDVDEKVGLWRIFSHRSDTPGLVDINDGIQDIFVGVPRILAEMLCAAQQAFREAVYAILCRPNQDQLIEALWGFRRQARRDKHFELADEVRALLESMGVDVVGRDTKEKGPLR